MEFRKLFLFLETEDIIIRPLERRKRLSSTYWHGFDWIVEFNWLLNENITLQLQKGTNTHTLTHTHSYLSNRNVHSQKENSTIHYKYLDLCTFFTPVAR